MHIKYTPSTSFDRLDQSAELALPTFTAPVIVIHIKYGYTNCDIIAKSCECVCNLNIAHRLCVKLVKL